MKSASHLLLARLNIEQLIAAAEWEDAAELGSAALGASINVVGGAPERLRIACRLTGLGMLGDVGAQDTLAQLLGTPDLERSDLSDGVRALKMASGDDFDGFLSGLSSAILKSNGASSSSLMQALKLLEVAAEHSDAHVAPALLSFQPVESAIRAALSDPNEANRGRGLSLLGTLLRTAPAELCARLCPVLSTAVLVEVPALQALALATLGDVAFALAHVPAAGEAEGDADASQQAVTATEELSVCVAQLSSLLYAPIIQLQHIAALSLSKLILGAVDALDGASPPPPAPVHVRRAARTPRTALAKPGGARGRRRGTRGGDPDSSSGDEDDTTAEILSERAVAEEEEEERWRQEISGRGESGATPAGSSGLEGDDDSLISGAMVGGVLLASTDVERLIAELAFRYTAELPLTAMSKADQAAHTTLMTAVLACFEALVAAHRTAELSNTIGAEPQAIDPWPHSPAQLVFSRVRKRSAISLETQCGCSLAPRRMVRSTQHAWLRRNSVLRMRSNRLAPSCRHWRGRRPSQTSWMSGRSAAFASSHLLLLAATRSRMIRDVRWSATCARRRGSICSLSMASTWEATRLLSGSASLTSSAELGIQDARAESVVIEESEDRGTVRIQMPSGVSGQRKRIDFTRRVGVLHIADHMIACRCSVSCGKSGRGSGRGACRLNERGASDAPPGEPSVLCAVDRPRVARVVRRTT